MTIGSPFANDEVCVALDLETTGLSPESDEIIEVGAVKFQGDRVLGTFQALANPFKTLTPFIRELTGITQGEVDSAPPFATVAPGLQEFLGRCPIVGQNIYFDLSFLANKGMKLPNADYDTRELASILLPQHREYSLAPLAASLGVVHPRPHRALADAEVTFMVFHALKQKALEMDDGVLSALHALYARARSHLGSWFRQLLEVKQRVSDSGPAAVGPGGIDVESLARRLDASPAPRTRRHAPPLDEDAIAGFFSEDGPLSRMIDGYSPRPQQVAMANAVARAMEEKRHLLVEAGTGVGKSMAYLLPALVHAHRNAARVVVSTNTINLQEQLIAKDVPTISRALTEWSASLTETRACLLKGRDNYLCLRRWNQLRREESLSAEEARMAAKALVWLQTTATGDRSELNMANRDLTLWSHMSASGAIECPPRTREACFLRAARERADGAHLVVVNHALLMSDLAEGGGLIPSYDHLIVDEAHHLEEEATRQLSSNTSQAIMDDLLGRLDGPRDIHKQLRGFLESLFSAPRAVVMEPLVRDGEEQMTRLRAASKTLWTTLATFLATHQEEAEARRVLLRVVRSTRTQPGWSKIEVEWENADTALASVANNLDRLSQGMAGLDGSQGPGLDALLMEVGSCSSDMAELREHLRAFIAQPDDDMVYWMTLEGREGELVLSAAPLHVGELLQKRLFSQKESVVFTSATLSTQGHFDHIRERLGLEEADELLVDSPFDYPNAVLLCLPTDMPTPTTGGYQEALQHAIADVGRSAGGRTMALFTSHAALQAARAGLKADLERDGIQVLAQGVDGPPRALLDTFLKTPKSVLLGTASFWEGVDIPGGALKALIVTRLPFNVPTDPVFAARSELFENPFNQYAVPQSVLRFRQGFGRLIRGERDRGVVVVLDQRILSRAYGAVFLDSIPECTTTKAPLRNLSRAVREWIAGTP